MRTVLLVAALVLLSGCFESQQKKVWGQGELSAEWRGYFGNSNIARLNFMQTQKIDQHQALIHGLDAKDPDGKPMRKRGLIERVTTLESLEARLEILEEKAIVNEDRIGIADDPNNKPSGWCWYGGPYITKYDPNGR